MSRWPRWIELKEHTNYVEERHLHLTALLQVHGDPCDEARRGVDVVRPSAWPSSFGQQLPANVQRQGAEYLVSRHVDSLPACVSFSAVEGSEDQRTDIGRSKRTLGLDRGIRHRGIRHRLIVDLDEDDRKQIVRGWQVG